MPVLVRANRGRIEMQRHHVDVPVTHAVLRDEHLPESVDIAIFAAQDDGFQAIRVIEHDVRGGDAYIVVVVA